MRQPTGEQHLFKSQFPQFFLYATCTTNMDRHNEQTIALVVCSSSSKRLICFHLQTARSVFHLQVIVLFCMRGNDWSKWSLTRWDGILPTERHHIPLIAFSLRSRWSGKHIMSQYDCFLISCKDHWGYQGQIRPNFSVPLVWWKQSATALSVCWNTLL